MRATSCRFRQPLRLRETLDHPELFALLDDSIFFTILNSERVELQDAVRILQNIQERKLYRRVGDARFPDRGMTAEGFERSRLQERFEREFRAKLPNCVRDVDYILKIIEVDYGMREENPLRKVRMYTKEHPDDPIPFPHETLFPIPREFREKKVMILSRDGRPETRRSTERELRRVLSECMEDLGLQ
ncbi:unnamed protein product [Darwinula stevensoni]|uniref:Uncharacterized protein n=1 Tax=Darwinula stevensoni TaxID=69355 RepID=A0A7R8XD11_9CRUS|nr:unnamed protein product [Darwinula stevensoni]CAG0886311.1 unnamed protein product [Darwinula stevensoni]